MYHISQNSGGPYSRSEQLAAITGGFSLNTISRELATFRTSSGNSLRELSYEIPLLLIFCCDTLGSSERSRLGELSCKCGEIELEGVVPVLVHCEASSCIEKLLAGVGLKDLCHISDPQRRLHSAFKLSKNLTQNSTGEQLESSYQQQGLLEGVCLLHEAEILRFARCGCLNELDCDSFISYPSQRIFQKYQALL